MIFRSLLVIAVWEFCRSQRLREFPALRRRLGNIGIWLLNILEWYHPVVEDLGGGDRGLAIIQFSKGNLGIGIAITVC
jgi:hypothetical protein